MFLSEVDGNKGPSWGLKPGLEYREAKILLAYKDGRLAGRMCAIINHAYNEKWHQKRIRFNR